MANPTASKTEKSAERRSICQLENVERNFNNCSSSDASIIAGLLLL